MSLLKYFPKKARLDSETVDCEQRSSHLEPSTEFTEQNVDVLSSLSSDVDGSNDSEQSESDSESATNTAVTGASSSSRGSKRYFTGWQKTFKWLQHSPEKGMTCKICLKAGKTGPFVNGSQKPPDAISECLNFTYACPNNLNTQNKLPGANTAHDPLC